jgi:hypothetical protein
LDLKKENKKYWKLIENITKEVIDGIVIRQKAILETKCSKCEIDKTKKIDCSLSKSFFKVFKDIFTKITFYKSTLKSVKEKAKELLSVFVKENGDNDEIDEIGLKYFT